jgi:hypothetical protein
MMGEPSGSSRREARTREERQTGKQCRSRKALDLNRPNREGPKDVGRLMYAATALLVITLVVNAAGAFIIQSTSVDQEGEKS